MSPSTSISGGFCPSEPMNHAPAQVPGLPVHPRTRVTTSHSVDTTIDKSQEATSPSFPPSLPSPRSNFHDIHRLLSLSSDDSTESSAATSPPVERREQKREEEELLQDCMHQWIQKNQGQEVENVIVPELPTDLSMEATLLDCKLDNIDGISDFIREIGMNDGLEKEVGINETPSDSDAKEVEVVFEGVRVECIDVEDSVDDSDDSSEEEGDEEEEDKEEISKNKDFPIKVALNDFENREKVSYKMPFKKRRRMRELQYPKSRFISINRNLIFDLTVEEEFKIHNINFRRSTEYTNFVKLMKQSEFQSSYDHYKKTIFTTAFTLDKVLRRELC